MTAENESHDWRIGSGLPPAFIPLNEDAATAISTRGQRLPSLLQTSRSTTSLFSLHRTTSRRRSTFFGDDHLDDEEATYMAAPTTNRLRRSKSHIAREEHDGRRSFIGPEILQTPQMRSMRLLGYNNPRYRWHKYYRTEDELKKMRKPIREYYERNNFLVAQYMYIDRLLDSSLPHSLIQEYENELDDPLPMIEEEAQSPKANGNGELRRSPNGEAVPVLKRTPRNLYTVPSEHSPLLAAQQHADDNDDEHESDDEEIPDIDYDYEADADVDSSNPVVTFAIYLNLAANVLLLAGKIAVIVLTSSLSVLASLVDAALDFLSTAIVWVTTSLIARQDQYAYPIGRRRLEPVGVLVFSVIMITSFFQVGLQCIQRLLGDDHEVVELGLPAIIIMLSTVAIKGFCWFWCRLIKNSSVQALAQDAVTDVVFNIFSIIFPLVGSYFKIWWLDALGGLCLSMYVIFNWSKTSSEHVRNLCGAAASADERNVLLYLTMRFAKTIKYIQGLQAYHAGDQLNVEVDIVLDESTSLRDTHDVSESLQYVLESVPMVDRAFVHADYKRVNLPSHMNQQAA